MTDPNGLTWAATLVSLAVAIPTAGHAVIYKRDPRSATLWVLLIALLPLGGSLLYGLFGINRYQRRARRLFPGARPRYPRLYRRHLPVWPTWWDAPPASR